MTKRALLIALLVILLLPACRRERAVQPLSDYESADVQAKAFNFQIYPGARFLEEQTDLLRRAHFAMNPDAKEAPPMALYESDAPLEQVAQFYGEKYGYRIADNMANDFKTVKPQAYYTTGTLEQDIEGVKGLANKLELNTDFEKAQGAYRAAYFSPQVTLPRVSLQRPWFNSLSSEVVDSTLIVMVRE
jgi:hypothetical protein